MNSAQKRTRPTGFPLLFRPDEQGGLSFPELEESVQQMLKVILRTRPGEQLMHSDFGAGLEQLVHEPNTLETRRAIHDLVATSITRWEPRILLDRVDVSEVSSDSAEVRVEISYRLRRTGVARQLGLSVTLGA